MISISGIPGAGKSTLANALGHKEGRPVVRFDDFELLTSWPPTRVAEWLAQGAPLSPDLAPGLMEAVEAAGPKAVLDHPFGRTWPGLEQSIDTAIWLDCPIDLALARKLADLAVAGQGDPGFAGWLSGWLEAYSAVSRDAITMLIENIPRKCDCIIDVGLTNQVNVFGEVCRCLTGRLG